jgi:hypothetical protein
MDATGLWVSCRLTRDPCMIERLITSLRALAAPADAQVARYPDFTVRADELALEFDDALLLVSDCPQLRLGGEQVEALARVDRLLERMSGAEHAGMWTEAALRGEPEWDRIRRAASEALRALGYAEDPPDA